MINNIDNFKHTFIALVSLLLILSEHLTKIVDIELTPPSSDIANAKEAVESVPVENVPVKVEIPEMDEKLLKEFFNTSTETTSNGKIDVTVDDFDHLLMTSNDV